MFRLRQLFLLCSLTFLNNAYSAESARSWILIDDFEHPDAIEQWVLADPDNNTDPRIEKPQVTEVRIEQGLNNHYLLKKPAAEGVIGNRKALSYKRLPEKVDTGEVFTFYTRINVEYFPNNHSFGLSNLTSERIAQENYNAFEPMIRITDKMESNGYKNSGALMVLKGHKSYIDIQNPETGSEAEPLEPGVWYELWWVIDNRKYLEGGQRYDLYVRGGEFKTQQKVYTAAEFRMKRELPLIFFTTISNTGSRKKPYGNGGVRYDDLYMVRGLMLETPVN